MHQQTNTEKELMEWFDRQERGTKWRINAYLIRAGLPMAEGLRFLKTIEDRNSRIHLVHPGTKQRH